MSAFRLKARVMMCALIVIGFCASTLACGGPGSPGTVNQDFSTEDEFFAGQFAGQVQISNFQTATFVFTGSTAGTVDPSLASLTIDTIAEPPADQVVAFQVKDYELSGTFNETNADFTLFGNVLTTADEDLGLVETRVPVQIVGNGGGSFASGIPGNFAMTIGGETFTGQVFRGDASIFEP